MKNYLRFLSPVLLLLMAVMFGGGKIYAKDVTVTQTSFSATSADNIDGDKNVFYSTAKGNASSNPYVTSNKILRLYQGTKGTNGTASKYGGTITISAVASAKIISISIGSKQNTTVAYSLDKETTQSKETSLPANKTVTVSDINASSVTFYNWGLTNNNRLDINYLSVTYSIEGSDKTSTTLSFSKSESSFTYNLNYNGGIAELVNPATLSPNVEGATISYTIPESTFADGEISVDNNGTVTFYTDKEASATITASYVGNDTYAASMASYIIKIVDPNAVLFSGENKSFANISTISGTGYKDGTINFVDGKDIEYSFTITDCMLNNDNLQMKATKGLVTSPKFGFTNGYTVTIEYTSGNGITLSAGEKTVTGEKNSSISLTTTSDIPFTIKTGSQYAVVTTIRVVANSAPKTETLTTSAGGYATYSADYAVNYSELGLTAYTITIDENKNTVTAKAFTGVVPAGKAVLVKGTKNTTYTLTPATTEGDATFATDLQTGATKADGTQYGFTSKSGTPAFAQVVSGQDIPAKKGYIVLNGASAAKYSICFDDEATGIHTIEAASAANDAMYNLAGQRVDKAYKGIVIVNGKKYLNK